MCWSILSATQQKADQESRAKEDRNVGLRNKPCQLSYQTRRQMNQSRNRSTTLGRKESTSSKAARHKDKLLLQDLYRKPTQGIAWLTTAKAPSDSSPLFSLLIHQLIQGKPAHLTLKRNPIKHEPLPNMILFSFVTVVLLEILVPKINQDVFNKINSVRLLSFISSVKDKG